jgi:hypothetical protein
MSIDTGSWRNMGASGGTGSRKVRSGGICEIWGNRVKKGEEAGFCREISGGTGSRKVRRRGFVGNRYPCGKFIFIFLFVASQFRSTLRQASWLRSMLFNPSSQSARRSTCDMIASLCQGEARQRQILDLLCG